MDISNYFLETNYFQWDANALIQYVETLPAESWSRETDVMPCVKLSGYEPEILKVTKEMAVDFTISLNELYIVKLKANSVLGKHSDSPRKVSFNFPLIGDFDSAYVKFYVNDALPPNYNLVTSDPLYMKKDKITLLRVENDHSFHNPTNNDIILLNLSITDNWDTAKSVVLSKSS